MSKENKRRYIYRIAPTGEQIQWLWQTSGCLRKAWNEIHANVKDIYTDWRTSPVLDKPLKTETVFVTRLVPLKKRLAYLYNVPSTALQQKIIDLGRAYINHHANRAKKPKFKSKKHGFQSIRVTDNNFKIVDNQLTISHCKTPFEVYWSRELPSKPSSVTILRQSDGHFYVSFVCERQPTRQRGTGSVGVDLGVKSLAVESNGKIHENLRFFQKLHRKLRKAQRSLSRKVGSRKGETKSQNWWKQNAIVNKIHRKIANCRKDLIHKLTSMLVQENQLISIETLNVKGMLKNRRLAKHIGDAAFGMFARFLEYKCQEAGVTLVKADAFFPSTQICSGCGKRKPTKLTLKEREWVCPHCNTTHDRDLNAALVLQILGEYLVKVHGTKQGTRVQGPRFEQLCTADSPFTFSPIES